MKKSTQVLKQVDPNLNVAHHRNNWDATGGAFCPRCEKEAVRFRPEDGVCRVCADELNEKFWQDEKKHAKWMRQVKAHNARIRRS